MITIGGLSPSVHTCSPTWKYIKITDDKTGTEGTIWTPASGKRICFNSFVISVTGAGVVEIKDGTDDDIIMVLDFGEKKAVPASLGHELVLPKDHTLVAKFTIDAASGDCHIAAFGREH